MRPILSSLILVLSLVIGELHNYWSNERVENWIVYAYRPMPQSWNVKFVGVELIIIMYFGAWLLYRPNKINRTTVIAFLWLAILDLFFFFYNFKLGGFGAVYFWFIAFWYLTYKAKKWTKPSGKKPDRK